MKRFLMCLGVALLAASCGCETSTPEPVGGAEMLNVVRTDRAFNNSPDNFQFAIMADRTGGRRPGVFTQAVEKLNLLQPEFVMSVGDLVEGYSEDEAQFDREREEIDDIVGRLDMPFFYVPGNHDISNEFMANNYRTHYGPPYYHFVYRNALFLCLNTEDPPATNFSSEQVEHVANALAENPDVRWTFLFMHKPMWIEGKDKGWDEVEKLLAGRPHTVFAGHHHTYLKDERGGNDYFMLATTGGASGLPDRVPVSLTISCGSR
ncbi:MAG: metallophosphoesterase [Planctomycetes bacterium]|nr:metallophosphoesterase [Planctomycetota bacterium]